MEQTYSCLNCGKSKEHMVGLYCCDECRAEGIKHNRWVESLIINSKKGNPRGGPMTQEESWKAKVNCS